MTTNQKRINKHWSEWGPGILKMGNVDSVGECFRMSGVMLLISVLMSVVVIFFIFLSIAYIFASVYWVYVCVVTGDKNFIFESFDGPDGRI